MLVSLFRRPARRFPTPLSVSVALCLAAATSSARARGPEPALRIDLRALDYQDFSSQMLESGAALLTTHFVDSNHLLVTFGRRRLLARIPDDPVDDLDRNLDALLLELPSGRLLARTSWRAHDIGQYLWPLGDGNFLLRDRNRLVTISPLRNLAGGAAFTQQPLLTSRRPIGALFVSADGKLLTVETLDRKAGSEERAPSPRTHAYTAAQAEAAPERRADPVQVNFFRIVSHPDTGQPLAVSAGEVRSPALILVPVDSAGYIATLDQGQHHYAFDFHQHTGKVDELSPFDSTCQPAPILVNHSEFIALGCRGGSNLQMLGGFNLRGEEMWEQVMPEAYVNPTFSFAPAAGRFAFGRVITTSAIEDGKHDALSRSLGVYPSGTGPVPSQIQNQTVNVFQMETGRILLTVTCAPVLRAGGNFALSADGSQLAVARNGAVEIYRLPALTGREQTLLAKAAGFAPQPNEAPVHLSGRAVALPTSAQEQQASSGSAPVPAVDPGAVAAGAPSTVPAVKDPAARSAITSAASEEPNGADQTVAVRAETPRQPPARTFPVNGDDPTTADESARRKPPTLYAPDEKPSGKPAETKTPNPQ